MAKSKYYYSHIEQRRAYQRAYQKMRREREKRMMLKDEMNMVYLEPKPGTE